MRPTTHLTTLALAATCAVSATAQRVTAPTDTIVLPERAVVVTGNPDKSSHLVAVLYDTRDLHFQDPKAPRFLFFDQKGKVALGIGGYVKATALYDFKGAIDNGSDFITYNIPVPANPAQRNQFFANASHSTIFLQLVGHNEKFGTYQMYIQTNFTGDNGGYGLKLKQAYVTVGNLKAGLARSTFVDGSAGLATIDDQGPSGATSSKNILVQYAPSIGRNWQLAISAEMPKAAYTTGTASASIKQRCPDIPIYAQYNYGSYSHIRLSAILRNLSYRDLENNTNRWATGWGLQLSGLTEITKGLTFYYQGAYGRGIAQYFNDLSGMDMDLIPGNTPGRLKAPGMLGIVGGLKYSLSDRLFVSGGYSQMRLFGQQSLGPDAYRYGQYVVANAFWNPTEDLTLAVEYLYGQRNDMSHSHGSANRLECMLQYSF